MGKVGNERKILRILFLQALHFLCLKCMLKLQENTIVNGNSFIINLFHFYNHLAFVKGNVLISGRKVKRNYGNHLDDIR